MCVHGRCFDDAFVAKMNAAGTALVYSTYLGGSGDDVGRSVAVDSSGNAYVTGGTASTNFPGASSSPIQSTFGGSADAFVAKIAPNRPFPSFPPQLTIQRCPPPTFILHAIFPLATSSIWGHPLTEP